MKRSNCLNRIWLLLPLILAVGACNEQPLEVAGEEATMPDGAFRGSVDALGSEVAAQNRDARRRAGLTRTDHVALANDIAFNVTKFNTDFAVAGVGGMRGVGSGVIALSGVTGPVTLALLYWHGPTFTTDPAANANVFVNGMSVAGSNIGFSGDNCWGFLNSQAYRADVTSLVAATGDGNYNLTGFGSFFPVHTNGASLVVFFNDGDGTNNRDVVVFDGNDSNFILVLNPNPNLYDAPGWNVTMAGINYSAGSANLQLHVSDGFHGSAFPFFLDPPLILNTITLDPGPQIFGGTTVPGGLDPRGNLWDIKSWDVTSFLSPGLNTLTLTTGWVEDCVSLIVAVVDLQAVPSVIDVDMDIKPNSDPNSVNLRRMGLLPVAIFGSASLDVNDIDANTVTLGDDDGNENVTLIATRRNGSLRASTEDVNEDGFMDLIMHFDTQELIDNGDLDASTEELFVNGETNDETAIAGSDSVRIVRTGRPLE